MSLKVEIDHRLGDFRVDVAFETAGRLTALFGRSGAGKTTIVNAIAGLIRPQRAKISVDGTVFVDTERRTFVPRHKRRVGYVFQEGRLFPHMTVRQNLLYGRWFAGKVETPVGLNEIVALLGIEHLLARRPAGLSGGEKQRIAIGRALLAAPRLLLMDEPLASLDEERKAEILPYVERLRDELRIPIVYVSHALGEVARLANTVVVLAEGRVASVGPVAEVLSTPAASRTGGEREAGGVLTARVVKHDVEDELTVLRCSAGQLMVPRIEARVGAKLRVHIRARDVMLAAERPTGLSALNILPAVVVEVGDTSGPIVDVGLSLGDDRLMASITRRSLHNLALEPGRRVFAVLKSVAIARDDMGNVFDAH